MAKSVSLMAALSDAGLTARTLQEFSRDAFAILSSRLPNEGGALHVGATGRPFKVGAVNYSQTLLEKRLSSFIAELSPVELRLTVTRAISSGELFSPPRLAATSMYREVMAPAKTKGVLVRGMATKEWNVGITIGRRKSADFAASEAGQLDEIFPTLAIAARLVHLRETEAQTTRARPWSSLPSNRERQVAVLVARGLRNREVAALLGISDNRVRNVLSTVFAKCDVTTRAELPYVLGEWGEEDYDEGYINLQKAFGFALKS